MTSDIKVDGVAAAVSASGAAKDASTIVKMVLADMTGYEVDRLEEDMNLESELGVDSIKRVEFLSRVQSQLNIEAKDTAALARTQKLGEVTQALEIELNVAVVQQVAAAAPATRAPRPPPARASTGRPWLRRRRSQAHPRPPRGRATGRRPSRARSVAASC